MYNNLTFFVKKYARTNKAITHVIFPLASLKWTSFIMKLVFSIAFADGVGRVPINGGGASVKS